jgi:hypothetical protein
VGYYAISAVYVLMAAFCLVPLQFQVTEAFLASRIPNSSAAAERGMNFGGYAVYSDQQCDAILQRNMPVFVK